MTMPTPPLTPTPVLAADRADRRVRAVVKINGKRKTGELSDLDALSRAFDAGLAEGAGIPAEVIAQAQADLAARDDKARPPSRPNVPPVGPPKAVEYYADIGGESGGA